MAISTAGLGFQTLWLYYAEHNNIMQNMFPLTWIQFRIPFPYGYCTYFRDGYLSQGQISVPITYISIRGSESESESESESGNGNKP